MMTPSAFATSGLLRMRPKAKDITTERLYLDTMPKRLLRPT